MADNHALELEVRINTAPNIASLETEIDALSKSLASHPLILATTIDPKAQQDQAKKALDAIGAQEIKVKLKEDGTSGSGKSKFVDDYTVQHKKRIHEIIEVYKELDAEEAHNHRAALNRTKERTAEIGRLRAEQRLNIAAAKEQERVESKLWSTAKIDGYNRQIDAVQANMVSLLDAQKNISSSGVIPTEFRQFDTLINEAYHSFTQLETALRAVNQSSGDDRVKAQKAFNDQLKFTEKALKAVEAESRKVNTQVAAMQKKVSGASGYEKRLAGISSAYNGNTAQIAGYDDIAGQIRDLKGIGTVDLSNYTAAKVLIEQIERKLNDAAIRASEFRSAMRMENKTTGLQNAIDHLEIYRNRLEVVRSSANKLVGGIPEELNSAMGSAEALISDLENIGDVDDGNISDVSAKFRELGVAMRLVATEMAKLRTHTSGNIGMEQREREINRMRVALETLYNSQSRLRSDPIVTSQFEGLMSRLNLDSIDSDEKLAAAKKEFDAITKSWNESGKAADSLGAKIGKMYAKFGGWSLITMSMTKAIQTIKAMISNVIELDTAMTELRKVTDETNTTYNRFLNGASKTAKSIGASLKDVVSATADFARLGYTLEDSAVLAKSAQVYLNVGDDLDGIDSATSSLISTIKAFGIEAADVMGIVDQFNEVSNNFAISSGGIGEALLRSASALSTANNSLAESIALITAANTTAQSPEHVGTTLKTVTMFLRAAKTEAEEAGESTDGMASSVAALRSELKALTGGKVDIMVDEDTFKSTYQILSDIADVWEELSETSQSNILNLIGGKRNANVTAALIEQFDVARNVLETAQNAAGSATLENEKYLESVQGHLAQTSTAFQNFSASVVNSEMVKVFIDIGTGILDIATGAQKLNLMLPGLVTGLTAIVMLRQKNKMASLFGQADSAVQTIIDEKKVNDSLKASILNYTAVQKARIVADLNAAVSADKLTKEQAEQIMTTLGLTSAQEGQVASAKQLDAATKVLGFSFKTFAGIAGAVMTVIGVASAIYQGYQQHMEELRAEVDEVTEAYENAAKTQKSNVKTLESLRGEYEKLADGIGENGENIKLTASEYDRYWEIVSQIADLSPSIVQGYDNERRAILDYKDAIDQAIEAQKEMQDRTEQIYISTGEDIFKVSAKDYKDNLNELEAYIRNAARDSLTNPILYQRFGVTGLNNPDVAFEEMLSSRQGITYIKELLDAEQAIMAGLSDQYDIGQLTEISNMFTTIRTKYDKVFEESVDKNTEYFMRLAQYNNQHGTNMDAFGWMQDIPTDALDELAASLAEVDRQLYLEGEKDFSDHINAMAVRGAEFAKVLNNLSAQALYEMIDGLKDGSVTIEDFNRSLDSYMGTHANLGADENVRSYFAGLADAAVEASRKAAEVEDELSSGISNTIDEFASRMTTLQKAYKESSQDGVISADTYRELSDAGEDYLKILELTEDGYKVNDESLRERILAMKEEYAVLLMKSGGENKHIRALGEHSQALLAQVADYDTLQGKVREYTSDLDQLQELQEKSKEEYVYTAAEIMELVSAYPELASGIEQTTNGFVIQESAIASVIKQYQTLAIEAVRAAKTTREADLLLSAGTSLTASNVDSIFASYEKENGRGIMSMSEFFEAHDRKFNNTLGSAAEMAEADEFIAGYLEYVQAHIDENLISSMYDSLLDGSYGTGTAEEKASASSSKEDKHVEAFEEKVAELAYLRKVDLKSEAEYYRELERLNEEYFGEAARQSLDASGELGYLDKWRENYTEYYDWKKEQDNASWEWREYQIGREEESEEKLVSLYKEWQKELDAQRRQMLSSGVYTADDQEVQAIIRQYDELSDKIKDIDDKQREAREQAKQEARDAILDGFDDQEYVINYRVEAGLVSEEEAIREYQAMCREIEDALAKAYSDGMTLTDEFVQSLIGKLNSTRSAIRSLYDNMASGFDMRIEMNNAISSMGGSSGVSNLDILKEAENYINKMYEMGVIDGKQYIGDMMDNIQKQYDELTKGAEDMQNAAVDSINAQKQALQELIEQLERVKDQYNDAANVVIKFIDRQMEGIQTSIDASEALHSSIIGVIDDEIDAIRELQDAEEDRISQYETAADTMTGYIDEQIAALREENDEMDRQVAIEEALLALEKAKNQRNKRVYREGVGFVWEADQDAIDSAQQEYDKLVSEDETKKKIEALEKYKEAIQDALGAYEKQTDESITEKVFGAEWKSIVDNLDYSSLSEFTDRLSEMQGNVSGYDEQIAGLEELKAVWEDALDIDDELADHKWAQEELTKFIGASLDQRHDMIDSFLTKYTADKRMYEKWEEYKQMWSDATTVYEEEIEKQNAAAILGADWESAVLAQRADVLTAWKEGYISVCDEIKYKQDVEMSQLDALAGAWESCFDSITGTMDTSLGAMNTFVGGFQSSISQLAETMKKLKEMYEEMATQEAEEQMKANSEAWNSLEEDIASADEAIVDVKIAVKKHEYSKDEGAEKIAAIEAEKQAKQEQQKELERQNLQIGTSLGWYRDNEAGIWYKEDGSRAYEEGGVADFTGLATLHGGSGYGAEMILNNSDVAKVYRLIHETDDLASRFLDSIFRSGSVYAQSAGRVTHNSITIGDIVIQKSDSPEGLAGDIVRRLPAIILQKMYKE